MNGHQIKVVIIGSGPAGLMCAARLAENTKYHITIYDQHACPSRKLIIAGKTGLNVASALHQRDIIKNYRGGATHHFKQIFDQFSRDDWVGFIHQMGVKTFVGASKKILIKDQTAEAFVGHWIRLLTEKGVCFKFKHHFIDFLDEGSAVKIFFKGRDAIKCDLLCLALGGKSYTDHHFEWVEALKDKGIVIPEFKASNVGYQVLWPGDLLKEAEGLPLKNISLTVGADVRKGELVITRYGLEGPPVYAIGSRGTAYLDLKPDMTEQDIRNRLKENLKKLSPYRLAVRRLNLCAARQALLYHCLSGTDRESVAGLVKKIKKFPVTLVGPADIKRAISCAGGVSFDSLDESLCLKAFPRVFCMGEMLDWDAPTGGFLIQGCVSQGAYVAGKIEARFSVP
ncbi:MAG: TIGR03862 family flavoprotein [Deltaproteobacteria bacterium]|nr:TIGR03862 family flavoprotein [Deltaproteobacteria bacterium]